MRRDHGKALVVAALALQGALTPAFLAYRLPSLAAARRQRAAFEARVAQLDEARRSVGGRSAIGYLSEAPLDPAHQRPDDDLARYYFAQSSLAPLLLDRALDRELSLAFFASPEGLRESVDRLGLRVVLPLAPGLALVEGRER